RRSELIASFHRQLSGFIPFTVNTVLAIQVEITFLTHLFVGIEQQHFSVKQSFVIMALFFQHSLAVIVPPTTMFQGGFSLLIFVVITGGLYFSFVIIP